MFASGRVVSLKLLTLRKVSLLRISVTLLCTLWLSPIELFVKKYHRFKLGNYLIVSLNINWKINFKCRAVSGLTGNRDMPLVVFHNSFTERQADAGTGIVFRII
jgi:hypothetical protein